MPKLCSKIAFRSRFSKSFTSTKTHFYPFLVFLSIFSHTIQVIFSSFYYHMCSIAQKKDANNVNNNNNNKNLGQHLNNVKIWRQQ